MRNLVCSNDAGADRTKRVKILAQGNLIVAELDVARRDVVKNRVSENVFRNIKFGSSAHRSSDDDCEFDFVVDLP